VFALVSSAGLAAAQSGTGTDKGLIWRVERAGKTGWLVGSIHMLTPDFYPLPDSMQNAFRKSVTLVEEADLDEMSSPAFMQLVMSKAMYPEGQTLETQLTKETYRLVSERLAKAGLPIEAFQRMKPWTIALTLVAMELKRGGFDPALGLDKHFHDQSKDAGKQFRALETPAEQIEYLEKLSPDLQDALLRESVDETDSELSQVKAIASAWRAGDAGTIEQIMLRPMKEEPGVYRSLLVDRNVRWMPKLEACFATDSCFVVVGAAHAIGPDGLVTMLKQKGYTIQQQ
jgi:uncharacterized protein